MTTMPDSSDPLEWLEEAERPTSRLEFHEQMRRCDERLVAIGRLVGEAIVPTTHAFLEADTHTTEEAAGIEQEVTRRCLRLEEACYTLMARQSPVAGDLRHIVSVVRSVADVQRSASLLRHVAQTLSWVHPPAMPQELRQLIEQLGEHASAVFNGGLAAWAQHDGLAANELDEADDEVDVLQKYLLTEVYTGRRSTEEAVSLALLGRYYERIADHGVEMGRHVAYFLTGERLSRVV